MLNPSAISVLVSFRRYSFCGISQVVISFIPYIKHATTSIHQQALAK